MIKCLACGAQTTTGRVVDICIECYMVLPPEIKADVTDAKIESRHYSKESAERYRKASAAAIAWLNEHPRVGQSKRSWNKFNGGPNGSK